MLPGHESHGEVRHGVKNLAHPGGDAGGHQGTRGRALPRPEDDPESHARHVHASQVQAVRQHARVIQSVPEMRPEVQMEPRARHVGRPSWFLRVLGLIAVAMLGSHHDPGRGSQPLNPRSHRQEQGQGHEHYEDIFREIVYGTPGDDDSDSDDEATFGGRLGPGRRHRDLRHHPGGLRGGDSGAPVRMEPLKKGQRQRLRGEVRRAHNILAAELKLNDTNRQPPRPRSQVDVLEVFAGVAEISARAPDFGLKSLTPIDYSTGYDLYKQDDADMVTTGISRFRPLYVIMGVDCKDWCLLQDNTNYIRRKKLTCPKPNPQ